MNNFPCDDQCGLDQLASGIDLSVFYGSMYVENEELTNPNDGLISPYTLFHVPVLQGSLVGKIYYKGELIQRFYSYSSGSKFSFQDELCKNSYLCSPRNRSKVVSGHIDHEQGNIQFKWNRPIQSGDSKVVVSYEYSR